MLFFQDGGSIGEVIDHTFKLRLDQVLVRWKANGNSFPYRRGQDGKIDLMATEPTAIGFYQPDALPEFTMLSLNDYSSAMSYISSNDDGFHYIKDEDSGHFPSTVDRKKNLCEKFNLEVNMGMENS